MKCGGENGSYCSLYFLCVVSSSVGLYARYSKEFNLYIVNGVNGRDIVFVRYVRSGLVIDQTNGLTEMRHARNFKVDVHDSKDNRDMTPLKFSKKGRAKDHVTHKNSLGVDMHSHERLL